MPKLNLQTILQIKNASGEITHLKGQGFEWPAATAGNFYAFPILTQSNSIGQDSFVGNDYPAGTLQVDQSGNIIAATSPLAYGSAPAGSMGFQVKFAQKWRELFPNDVLCFIPCSQSNTGYTDNQWKQGDPLYNSLVSRTNTFMTNNPAYQMGAFLMHGGETDALGGSTSANAFEGILDATVGHLRTDVTAASSTTPFLVGGMVPTWVGIDTDRLAVQEALIDLPNRVSHCGISLSKDLSAFDGIHFDSLSLVELGDRYYDSLTAVGQWTISGNDITVTPNNLTVPYISGTDITV